jgi:hypothetical protein
VHTTAHEQIQHNIDILKPGLAFREYAERAWDIPDQYFANRHDLAAHGGGMTGEYPCLYHRADFPAAGYDGDRIFSITHGRIRIIPPEARHVDCDIVPLTVAEGCLHKRRFRRVKNRRPFRPLAPWVIREQIAALRTISDRTWKIGTPFFWGRRQPPHARTGKEGFPLLNQAQNPKTEVIVKASFVNN